MRALNTHASVHRTLLFFLVTFVLSWSIWIPLAVTGSENGLLDVAGRFGPLVAALLLTGIFDERAGLARPSRVVCICVSGNCSSSAGCHRNPRGAGGHDAAVQRPCTALSGLPVFLYVLFLSVAGEETGWRGYALPRLQAQWGALPASLVIGLVWGVWHLPLFWMAGSFHTQIPFGLFLLQDVALSVVMTWLFNGTGGSLLLVHLFHAASNTTIGVLPILPQDTGGDTRSLGIAVALLSIVAVIVAARRYSHANTLRR